MKERGRSTLKMSLLLSVGRNVESSLVGRVNEGAHVQKRHEGRAWVG